MGFSYQTTGGSRLLCCDVCGHAGGCRKVPCPAGFCQAVALCGGCRKDPEVTARLKAYHVENDCAGASAAFDAEQAAVAALQGAGEYVFLFSVRHGAWAVVEKRGTFSLHASEAAAISYVGSHCSSDDQTNHQGDTCPIHEAVR